MEYSYAVALTGGIATGKSTAAQIFRSFGYTVIDADAIAHEILNTQVQAISEAFGEAFIVSGSVDRKALGALVFSDNTKRKKLEALLHPLIRLEIEKRAFQEEKYAKPYFVDIPLFFETEGYPIQKSLLVYASKEQQLRRLISRDSHSETEALARIEAQMPIEEKRTLAQYVVDNSGTLEQLEQECKRIIQEIEDDSY